MGMIVVSHETITTIHWVASYDSNLLTAIIWLPISTSIARNRRSVSVFSAVCVFRINEVVAHSKVMAHLMDQRLSEEKKTCMN